jgi:hypothetical protein
MVLEFNLKSMPFVSSYPTTTQWTNIGYNDLKMLFEQGVSGDYSELFWGLYDLLPTINNNKYPIEDLYTELFTVKSKALPDGDRMVEAVYGGSIKRFEDQIVLVFGARTFPITQDKKRLTCGGLVGDLVAFPSGTDSNGNPTYRIVWQPELSVPDGQGDTRDYIFSFPVLLAQDKDRNALHIPSPELLTRGIAKGSLLDFIAEHNSGNSEFTRYGVVNPKVEGERILKAYELFDQNAGLGSFKVIGVQAGVGESKKSDGTVENFNSVLFQLEDGRKANANSDALKSFWSWTDEEREASIPFIWMIDKYEAKKSKSSIKMIPKATKAVSSTKFPDAPWLAAIPSKQAIAPVKSAALVGAVETQSEPIKSAALASAVETQSEPVKSAEIDEDDIPF